MRRLLVLVLLLAGLAAGAAAAALAAAASGQVGESVVEIGHDARIDGAVKRVVVVGGDVRLGPRARVEKEVIVLFDYRAGRPTPVGERLRGAILALERTGAERDAER